MHLLFARKVALGEFLILRHPHGQQKSGDKFIIIMYQCYHVVLLD